VPVAARDEQVGVVAGDRGDVGRAALHRHGGDREGRAGERDDVGEQADRAMQERGRSGVTGGPVVFDVLEPGRQDGAVARVAGCDAFAAGRLQPGVGVRARPG
jgi:hypothetical protein